MIATALIALAVAALAPLLPTRKVPWLGSAVAAAGLAVAGAVAAALPDPVTGVPLVLALVLAVAAAATGGVPLVPLAFTIARRQDSTGPEPAVLHGGLVIGVLERLAVAVSVVSGWPEGIAVVLAVKGLARYPDVRDAHASEHFIIGTFTSVLWALACSGVAAGIAH
ncbi:hypothetical protein GCM10007304_24900 [Rhodococcoides trifolii]|uniref:Uncharacterized protein n=1 Tax=Rhodococcoides trifolii TaxID=908250 RepID=A0A917D4F3_9NOCA|nr:hypothetical protein [Rhodococcus trifolii]GGG09833.1 hypothetical protein GCM10007304_24900 [Rhodococcus trifolii]